jgi:hypothetical protein
MNLLFLGFGLWMIGDGIPGINTVGGVLKVAGGVLAILAAIGISV